ncbi:putative membrane protein [Alteromonas macleodii]|uniref:Membrane protein n=1 Tax=Alteromonas macleodii TaxID=28108 RepID=A0AB36FQK2_ALTMA|nr:putative membrane protein [Alteromonas macleodii]OES30119.1 putative membrane protein [Alteromonas macleodii]OES30518.1 putative membrane protein [Alteromonas macleodii]OES40455.1 putative membrane protein [Alteromonas macleodii]
MVTALLTSSVLNAFIFCSLVISSLFLLIFRKKKRCRYVFS